MISIVGGDFKHHKMMLLTHPYALGKFQQALQEATNEREKYASSALLLMLKNLTALYTSRACNNLPFSTLPPLPYLTTRLVNMSVLYTYVYTFIVYIHYYTPGLMINAKNTLES